MRTHEHASVLCPTLLATAPDLQLSDQHDSQNVQAFREDRTLIAAADYIADALGQRFVESVPLNMERAWSESHPKCPLICLLSPGADPTKLIEVTLQTADHLCHLMYLFAQAALHLEPDWTVLEQGLHFYVGS